MRFKPVVRTVTQETIDAYEEILRIGNPLHIDEEYVKTTPFGGIIAHGMMVLAYVSEVMAQAFGDGWYCGGELDTTFVLPVRPGDTITTSVRATDQKAVGGDTYVLCEIYSENQKGQKVLSGIGSARVAAPIAGLPQAPPSA